MTITYPEVQISGTAEEICAVLQCLMLNVAAGSLREEMDRVAEAMGAVDEHPKNVYCKTQYEEDSPLCGPPIEDFFEPEQYSDEEEATEEPEEYGDTPEGHLLQAIFGDPAVMPELNPAPEPEEKPSQEPEKKKQPKADCHTSAKPRKCSGREG